MRLATGVTLTARLDAELAASAATYAGTGTLHMRGETDLRRSARCARDSAVGFADWSCVVGRGIIAPRRTNSAQLHRPWRANKIRQLDSWRRVWAERIEEHFDRGTSEIYRVASNLVNGLPPRYRDHGDVSPTSQRKR